MTDSEVSQITTVSFFRYTGFKNKFWAFKMMNEGHQMLANVSGLQFYKLMGSGKGRGFSPFPDFGTYALLQVWNNEASAVEHFESGDLFKAYKSRASEVFTLFLKAVQSKGLWSGGNPFQEDTHFDKTNSPIAVITRATIKWNKMISFWRYVPKSQKNLLSNPGLLFTKGIGEAPLVQMSTFSLWKDEKALETFAYRQKGHQKAIQLTRKLDWYKEELFVRFAVMRTSGYLSGVNLT